MVSKKNNKNPHVCTHGQLSCIDCHLLSPLLVSIWIICHNNRKNTHKLNGLSKSDESWVVFCSGLNHFNPYQSGQPQKLKKTLLKIGCCTKMCVESPAAGACGTLSGNCFYYSGYKWEVNYHLFPSLSHTSTEYHIYLVSSPKPHSTDTTEL